MIPSITFLNLFGESFLDFAVPMFWQSSLLILCLFALDLLLARKIRASVRYAFWLVILAKLLLPPTLALPTGPAWWLLHSNSPVAPIARHYVITYGPTPAAQDLALVNQPIPAPKPPALEGQGWVLLIWGLVGAGLFLWLLIRWWQIKQIVRRATPSENLCGELAAAQSVARWRGQVRLKLITGGLSPSVCGWFHPVILLPRILVENLSDAQRHTVLLHEIFHVRRRDVWINFAQALLQIAYWWHPLLWFANARIRRLREEAVDDAVMLALRDQAETYAPTLLEVAKLTIHRPLLSLGLVGVMESRSALRQRIERLLDFRAPRKAGLTCASVVTIVCFSVVALPMGEAPTLVHHQVIPDTYDPVRDWQRTNSNQTVPVGLFQDPNFLAELKALEQRGGSDSLPEPEVVKGKYEEGVNWWSPTAISGWKVRGWQRTNSNQRVPAGVLADPNFRVALQALNQRRGSTPFPEPETVTNNAIGFNWWIGQFLRGWENGNGAITLNTNIFLNTNSEELFERTFLLNSNAFYSFYSNLEKSDWWPADNVANSVKSLSSKMGVNWESPKGKEVFYTERLGLLFVKATSSDLDLVKRTVENIRQPPEIHIKSWFFEAPKGTLDDLNRSMVLPCSFADGFVGILNSQNAKATFLAFQSRQDVKLLAEPEVITTSGQQCEIRATETVTVATNYLVTDTWADQNEVLVTNAIAPQTNKVEIGPILNVVPHLLEDGYTINLELNASLTEFLGYNTSANASDAFDIGWQQIDVPALRPSLRIRTTIADLNQWDGQTSVIGDLNQTYWAIGKEKVGRKEHAENELLLFVTATLVDSRDHRIHTDEEMPFAKNWFPPQPPVVRNRK